MTPPESRADAFLGSVVVSYGQAGEPDPSRWHQAKRLLDDNPEIRDASIHTAAAIGDVGGVRGWLDQDSELANAPGGPFDWPPLMYAAYARLPGSSTLAVGKMLLARGADPNAHTILNDQYRFTALTGVFGQGESGPVRQPEHPDCVAFARALLDAGADPNDSQAAYNRMFLPDNTCLKLLIEYGLRPTDLNNWLDPDDSLGPVETMHFQLIWAVRQRMTARAKLLIDHGVDVDKPDTTIGPNKGRTPYELAILSGDTESAAYLLAHGATRTELGEPDRFVGACMAADRAQAESLLKAHPDLARQAQEAHPEMTHDAARANNLAAMGLMIDLGIDIDRMTATTALHQAAWHGHLDMVKLMVARGADPTRRDLEHCAPPIGWAAYADQKEIVDFLDGQDMDVFAAAARGNLPQLERHLDATPDLVNMRFTSVLPDGAETGMGWMTPLAFAVVNGRTETASVLLGRGADPAVTDERGGTLAELAESHGNDELAALLSGTVEAGGRP